LLHALPLPLLSLRLPLLVLLLSPVLLEGHWLGLLLFVLLLWPALLLMLRLSRLLFVLLPLRWELWLLRFVLLLLLLRVLPVACGEALLGLLGRSPAVPRASKSWLEVALLPCWLGLGTLASSTLLLLNKVWPPQSDSSAMLSWIY
jgi:hypothetical protein